MMENPFSGLMTGGSGHQSYRPLATQQQQQQLDQPDLGEHLIIVEESTTHHANNPTDDSSTSRASMDGSSIEMREFGQEEDGFYREHSGMHAASGVHSTSSPQWRSLLKQYGPRAGLAVLLFVVCTVAALQFTDDDKSPTTSTPSTTLKDPALNKTQVTSSVTGLQLVSPSSPSASFLPEFTMEKILKFPFSAPQSKAFQFVQQHPDFHSMPLWRKQQLMALYTIRFSGKMSWDPASHDNECEWDAYSSPCDGNGQYKSLYLRAPSRGHASWTIPPEVSFLTALTSLQSQDSKLSGPLPTHIGRLTALKYLGLNYNHMTGLLPTQLGLLTNMRNVGLKGNQFSGPLFTELGLMTSLLDMSLGQNRLTGTLPTELGLLSGLESWEMESNLISGPLPTALNGMLKLSNLDVKSNRFSGTISTELCMPAMETLFLFHNRFNGTIPTTLSQMTYLYELGLAGNGFVGSIPTELGLLTNMDQISFHDNLLTGHVPSQLGQMTSLEWLWVQNNSLTGVIPPAVCGLAWLNNLKIDCENVTCSCSLECICD